MGVVLRSCNMGLFDGSRRVFEQRVYRWPEKRRDQGSRLPLDGRRGKEPLL